MLKASLIALTIVSLLLISMLVVAIIVGTSSPPPVAPVVCNGKGQKSEAAEGEVALCECDAGYLGVNCEFREPVDGDVWKVSRPGGTMSIEDDPDNLSEMTFNVTKDAGVVTMTSREKRTNLLKDADDNFIGFGTPGSAYLVMVLTPGTSNYCTLFATAALSNKAGDVTNYAKYTNEEAIFISCAPNTVALPSKFDFTSKFLLDMKFVRSAADTAALEAEAEAEAETP
jgi:hypothetical protein